jgi:hypothetical protein
MRDRRTRIDVHRDDVSDVKTLNNRLSKEERKMIEKGTYLIKNRFLRRIDILEVLNRFLKQEFSPVIGFAVVLNETGAFALNNDEKQRK